MQFDTNNDDETKSVDPTVPVDDAEPTSAPEVADDASTELTEVVDEPGVDSAVTAKPGDDPVTDTAIDEMLKEEADQLLALDDAQNAALVASANKRGFGQKLKTALQNWWYNKWARWGTIVGLVVVLTLAIALPASRYQILNTFGVRASASVTILDDSTDLPLKNATVQLGGAEAKTNEKGEAKLTNVRLGSDDMVVKRIAFAELREPVTVGWGSNPFGELSLTAVGAKYTFIVHDYLSDKPIEKVEITSGEASAFADKEGKVVLVLEDPEGDMVEVTVTADGYREEKIALQTTTATEQQLRLVPDKPLVYISKQSGTYDVYRMDIDGKNKQLVLAGTGNENEDLRVVTSPDGTTAAVSSIRSSARDSGGYPLRSLTLVDLKSGKTSAIDQAQHFSFVGWVDNRLVYQVTYAAPSAASNQRQRLVSYDVTEGARALLTTTDYFTGYFISGDDIYYATSASDTSQASSLYRIGIDGKDKRTILKEQIWGLSRINYTTIAIETANGWYEYTIGASEAKKTNPPGNPYASRNYVARTDSVESLWIDQRDGKGVILLHNAQKDEDTVLTTASGISQPLEWLNDSVFVYRVQTTAETAVYAQSAVGGSSLKLTDVTASLGFTPLVY